MDRYMSSVKEDSAPELREFARGLLLGERPALAVVSELATAAVTAVEKGSESSYWEHIEKHQEAIFELHRRYTSGLLDNSSPGPEDAWGFIQAHGWRRFRFTDLVLRLRMDFKKDGWTVMIIPNYRTCFIERARSRPMTEGQAAVLDAVEMENLLTYGEPKVVRAVLQEKAEDFAGSRHILWGNPASPQFLKLRLKNANSTMHVSDWVLPLRS